jgi:hypothetical protein
LQKYPAEKKGSFKYFDVIMALFVAVLLISNIASVKIVELWKFTFDGGTILRLAGQCYRNLYGAISKDNKEIAMLTRSILEVIIDISADIEVPAAHVEEKRVGPTHVEEAVKDGKILWSKLYSCDTWEVVL